METVVPEGIQKDLRAFHAVTAVTLALFTGMLVWMNSAADAPLLVFVFLLGALGALLSEHLQVRRALKGAESLADVSTRVVLFSPVTGGILALAFVAVLASDLLQGDLFPSFKALDATFTSSYDLLRSFAPSTNTDFFKLCFWSSAAGFSERIVTQRFKSFSEMGSKG
ncbi:MAG: hypothetical protein AAFY88_16400 [Acidobacteriota bacterium]